MLLVILNGNISQGGAGKCGVVKRGDEKSLLGSVRSVPGTHEEVLRAAHGEFIEYTLKNNYIFPVAKHKGEIRFTAESDGTYITWTVKYCPQYCMNWLCCVMLGMLPLFLSHLKRKTDENIDKKHH